MIVAMCLEPRKEEGRGCIIWSSVYYSRYEERKSTNRIVLGTYSFERLG